VQSGLPQSDVRPARRTNAKSLGRPHVCHCEERSDEAIPTVSMGDCFAALAMTCRAAFPNERWIGLGPLVRWVLDPRGYPNGASLDA
jgi:hypothetical protein